MPYSRDPAAYPPEFLLLYKKGYEAPITIPCETRGKAVGLRHRLHAYRRALGFTKHPHYEMTMGCEIHIEGTDLTVQPSSILIRQALTAAGVNIEAALAEISISPEDEAQFDDLFKRLQETGE